MCLRTPGRGVEFDQQVPSELCPEFPILSENTSVERAVNFGVQVLGVRLEVACPEVAGSARMRP